MAGLYIHIPFCASRCIYCGFYSTTRADLRQRYVDALCGEMALCQPSALSTIYLGGGTPSQLSFSQLQQLFIYINKVFDVYPDAEITMECNPDDVTPEFTEKLRQLPVNRVSMGVQSFDDARLCFLRRRHTTAQIGPAVELLRKAGIHNISIDLMYGFPGETLAEWHRDIEAALALRVEHLSAYSLQYEEGTMLYRLLEKGEVEEIDEELERQMYYDLIDRLAEAGFEHYEISNFARPGYRSRHNSSYWNHTPYIGLGAAAHSYDGSTRRWNVADVTAYIEGIEQGKPRFDFEHLDEATRYNDLVMTALRTSDGLLLTLLNPQQRTYCLRMAEKYINSGLLCHIDNHLVLTRDGLFVSDMVMADLMMV